MDRKVSTWLVIGAIVTLGLVSALKKLEIWSQRIPMDANPATAHMFIIKPFTGSVLSRLFSTHPSTEQRIERLMALR